MPVFDTYKCRVTSHVAYFASLHLNSLQCDTMSNVSYESVNSKKLNADSWYLQWTCLFSS